jgi:lysophospholipase L1-like esterase
MIKKTVSLFGCFFAMTLSVAEMKPWIFREGDVWCATGDSITQSGLYHRDVYLFHVTRFPGLRIRQFNRGIGGDTATGALRRLEHDILGPEPTIATLMFGMNDVNRFAYRVDSVKPDIREQRDQAITTCLQNLRRLTESLTAAGGRVVLLTPSIFDQTAVFLEGDNVDAVGFEAEGVNTGLGRIAIGVRELAAELKVPVVDFHATMTAFNARAQASDPSYTLVGPDRVHPGAEGHFFMTQVFLESVGAPRLVSSIDLDAAARIGTAINGELDGLESSPEHVRFTFHAGALPFPLDATLPDPAALQRFQERFNQELLRVRGLKAGRYRLIIDNVFVGEFGADEFKDGMNLADFPATPQYQQAVKVRERLRRRHQLVSEGLRTLSFVEHGYLNGSGVAMDDVPAIRKVLTEKLEEIRGQPWYDYVKGLFDVYIENKALEPEMLRKADELEEALWQTARPMPRHYHIMVVN